jgi:CheY-like chemotaxis protein
MSARILVIDDNPVNLHLMTYLLRAFGHTALEAKNGEEGLDLARSESPDLILCDLQLPEMDGYELARRLREDPRGCVVPLVAVTACAMADDRDKVMAAGFEGYITKPIVPEDFVRQTECFLKQDRRSGASQRADHREDSVPAGEPKQQPDHNPPSG